MSGEVFLSVLGVAGALWLGRLCYILGRLDGREAAQEAARRV